MSSLRNKTHKELVALSRSIVQPLLPHFHKGQSGRIAVVGGCEDYTGAPFFAAHSAALLGCDLSHVICEKAAAPIIKLYLPDLMVHPYIADTTSLLSLLHNQSLSSSDSSLDADKKKYIESLIVPKIAGLLERMNLVVVGPGFGRDPAMAYTLKLIIQQVKVLNLPVVLDADALYLVSQDPLIIANYPKAVITPNVVEFQRLAKALDEPFDITEKSSVQDDIELTIRISKKLGGVTVVRKGASEIIVNNDNYCINELFGLPRRVGGQGDSLAGALSIFLTWAYNYQAGLWQKPEIETGDSVLLACFAASLVVRMASRKAFEKYGRAMQTLNVHEFLGASYKELYE